MKKTIFLILALAAALAASAQSPWYTQGDFEPALRIEYTVSNPLDEARTASPVILRRADFPMPDLHEMWVTVVDPQLTPYEGPSQELLARQGGHSLLKETGGHILFHQLDDLDRDGIWDELFFQIDLKARESRTVYIYIGENHRGWNPHRTHANIGSYCRHLMPFWENEYVGWKIWFANSADVWAKREPVLAAPLLYITNQDGYGMDKVDSIYGSDIQRVAGSFGGGAICLFENPDDRATPSMPRFTPAHDALAPGSLWPAGQISDTRYAYEVITNGPVRSMIKVKGMNWNSGNGVYEYEQIYSIEAGTHYTTCRVNFTKFFPKELGVEFGCGIRQKPEQNNFVQEGGLVITSGPENVRDPEDIDNRPEWRVDFIGMALAVKPEYRPTYQHIPTRNGNHAFRIAPNDACSYEYMVMASWEQGPLYNTKDSFNAYARKTYREYQAPIETKFVKIERK